MSKLSPYEEGLNAYLQGYSIASNPYEKLTPEYEEWNDGYLGY